MRPNPPTHPPTHLHRCVCVCVCPVDRDRSDRQLALSRQLENHPHPASIEVPTWEHHQIWSSKIIGRLVSRSVREREGREGERQN